MLPKEDQQPNIRIEETYSGRFIPVKYRDDYFGRNGEKIRLGFENDSLLRFNAEVFQDMKPGGLMLDFGCGPTIYSEISATPTVDEIHVADYLKENLDEIKRWKDNDPQVGTYWHPFIRRALQLERHTNEISDEEVVAREEEMRKKVTRMLPYNAFLSDPIVPEYRGKYDIVAMNFVAESITDNLAAWGIVLNNVASLVKPGGKLVMTFLEGAQFYKIGNRLFPAANISSSMVKDTLHSIGFKKEQLHTISSEHAIANNRTLGKKPRFHGYEGMGFYVGEKAADVTLTNGNGHNNKLLTRENTAPHNLLLSS